MAVQPFVRGVVLSEVLVTREFNLVRNMDSTCLSRLLAPLTRESAP